MDYFDNEYDIRPYIQVLLKQWWKIGLVTLLFAVIGFIFVLASPETYTSTANIIVREDNLRLLLADQFQTIPDTVSLQSRTESLQAIAASSSIAHNILNALGDDLPDDLDKVNKLLDIVEVTTNGEIIRISVTHTDPVLATEIASEWANNAITTINEAYADTQPLLEIKSLVAEKQLEYQVAQSQLENFYSENSIIPLETELETLRSSIIRLSSEKSDRLNILVWQKQTLEDYIFWTENLAEQLSDSNSPNMSLGQTLAVLNAENIFVKTANVRLGQPAAILNSESIFGNINTVNTPGGIDLSISDEMLMQYNRSISLDELENLINLAKDEIESLDEEISTIVVNDLGFENNEEIDFLTDQVQVVQTDLENQRALEQELITSRNLTLEAYNAVLAKENEIRTEITTNQKVNLVNSVNVPDEPEPRNTIVNTLIAGVIGGIISVTWILVQYWWTSSDETQTPE